jgi:hypothetical protein
MSHIRCGLSVATGNETAACPYSPWSAKKTLHPYQEKIAIPTLLKMRAGWSRTVVASKVLISVKTRATKPKADLSSLFSGKGR